ncbi:hypothetical protein ACKI2C_52300, partial [Streptomyces brasiliscabiei]|uniref:hypothetical protein n=1 Tax=Streptomyces brasiliscabiei TaxID=2736302 RepID=UPI0038F7AB26
FEAPKSNITSALPEVQTQEEESDSYFMPKVVEGKTEFLISGITKQAEKHNPLVLDCSRLERVEFGASAQLLNGLAP